MTETYTIRPLEWKDVSSFTGYDYSVAETPFGSLLIERMSLESPWKWGGYFQPGPPIYPCDSLAHGKQLAEAYWRERIMQALVKVEQ